MNILDFGSLNIDHVYRVKHFVQPGETLSSLTYSRFAGGKGANQSVALARAGANVFHAGKLGKDGEWLKEKLRGAGVNVDFTEIIDGPSGHAIIQVNEEGENSIILHGGANMQIEKSDAEKVISNFSRGDFLLCQNEISSIDEIFKVAHRLGMKIMFNPSPMNDKVLSYPLDLVDIFIINEIEGKELTGKSEPDEIVSEMISKFKGASVVLTLGSKGAIFADSTGKINVPAVKVVPVDTTAAGDTFTGFFLANFADGKDARSCLEIAAKAAALCVTRPGASDSIPSKDEVEKL